MSKKDEVIKDVRTVQQLENELQLTVTNHSVAVLDIYGTDWGACKALNEFFKNLYFNNNNLKFYSVDLDAVLANLKIPPEDRGYQRPRNVEHMRDTLSEHWAPILESRVGYSKPFFLFYKEGKMVKEVHGANAPVLKAYVKDLCAVKTPASDFISNPRLLEQWDENFNADESEVSWEKFLKGLGVMCKLTVALDEAERKLLAEALKISMEAKEKIVTAENLQNWIGDDEKTILQAFQELLPDYDERATKVRLQKEEEERIRLEKEAVARAEEEKRKAEEDAKAAAEKKKREDEEARLAKEREQKEKEEMSESRLKQYEDELKICNDKVTALEVAPLTSAAVHVEGPYFQRVHQMITNRVAGFSKERAGTSLCALDTPEEVTSCLDFVAAQLAKVDVETTNFIELVGEALSLKTPQLAAVHNVFVEGGAQPNGLDNVIHYAFTGDAAQLSLEENTSIAAIYPRVFAALAAKAEDQIKALLGIIAAIFTLPTNDEVAGEARVVLKGAAADQIKASLKEGGAVCFPILLATTNAANTGDLTLKLKGLPKCTALRGAAFIDESKSDYLVPPFSVFAVSGVTAEGAVLEYKGSGKEGVADAANPLHAAVDKTKLVRQKIESGLDKADKELLAMGKLQAAVVARDSAQQKFTTLQAKIKAKLEEEEAKHKAQEEAAKQKAEEEAKAAPPPEGTPAANPAATQPAGEPATTTDPTHPAPAATNGAKPAEPAATTPAPATGTTETTPADPAKTPADPAKTPADPAKTPADPAKTPAPAPAPAPGTGTTEAKPAEPAATTEAKPATTGTTEAKPANPAAPAPAPAS